ncbi:energy transducer TonB [Kiritimatiellota bacterium B12222]|nr:energy transducer TonB [Kiritimatiellota bacterium B12222]
MTRFQAFFKVITWHVVVLGLLFLFPLIKGCEWFEKKEQIITVDLASIPLPPPPEVEEPEPEDPREEEAYAEATPVPVPTATPQPTPTPQATATPQAEATPVPTSTPQPASTPKPQPTPTPKSKLLTPEQIRARIMQQQNQTPVVAVPTLSPQQIEAMMGSGLPTVGGAGGASVGAGNGATVNFGGVSSELYNRLFSAWQQPTQLSSNSGLYAIASVEVLRSGNIGNSRIIRRSGNSEFDQSVLKALSVVKFAKPLPDSYDGSSRTFEIEFKFPQ